MRMLNGSLPGSEVDRYTGFPYRGPDVRAAGVRVGRGEGSPKLREAALHQYPRRVLRSGSRGLRLVAAGGRGISPQDRRPDRWPVLCCRLHLTWHRLSPDFGAKSERARKETLWASSDTALIRRILPGSPPRRVPATTR